MIPYEFHLFFKYLEQHDKNLFDILQHRGCKFSSINEYTLKETDDINFLIEIKRLPELPEKIDKNSFFFVLDYTLFQRPRNQSFYFCAYLLEWINQLSNLPVINNVDTEYLFSCASRNFNNGRPGKIYNYIKLKDKLYYNQILFTKFQINLLESFYFVQTQDPEFYACFKQLEQEYYSWPKADVSNNSIGHAMTAINLDVYQKSLFHIVAETSVTQPYLSEKTYKIFVVGQIPIFCAAQGAVQLLRNLGFDVFDDIVDHNYYDNEPDWKTRITRMHKVLDHLSTLNHEQIKFDTYQRRLYNQQRIASADLQKLIFDPIITQLNQHFQGK
jgi:hypothetical protein